MSINLPAPVMTTPFQPKLGFDNYALRSLGWKARQILIHAAKLKLDAVLFSDFDVYESLADDHLRDAGHDLAQQDAPAFVAGA
ncbi:MAG: hypothetical protein EB141_07300, partial [Verrucomicrobia bacterium]|nr:hypothetical protein [Verrucomicrobiota bacterium]